MEYETGRDKIPAQQESKEELMNHMDTGKAAQRIAALTQQDIVRQNEPMKNHTTFRIGGAADLFITPATEEQLRMSLGILKEEEIPYFIIGNGSNILVSDEGIRGAVISLGRSMTGIAVNENLIRAEAGTLLSQIANAAREHSLTGLEFAGGIPGSLGGACMMNAGAYGGEMKQVLRSVRYLDETGEFHDLSAEQLELGYRTSVFQKHPWIVVSAEISLEKGNRERINEKMDDLRARRQEKQPLNYPSAGSTFKRPEGYFAGKLIMDAGLRGYAVGGAQVSEKHCGFVINRGNATATDVCRLIRDVQNRVREKFGVELQTEVRFLGEFRE